MFVATVLAISSSALVPKLQFRQVSTILLDIASVIVGRDSTESVKILLMPSRSCRDSTAKSWSSKMTGTSFQCAISSIRSGSKEALIICTAGGEEDKNKINRQTLSSVTDNQSIRKAASS